MSINIEVFLCCFYLARGGGKEQERWLLEPGLSGLKGDDLLTFEPTALQMFPEEEERDGDSSNVGAGGRRASDRDEGATDGDVNGSFCSKAIALRNFMLVKALAEALRGPGQKLDNISWLRWLRRLRWFPWL